MSASRTRLSTADAVTALTLLYRFSVRIDLVASAALPLGKTVPNVDIQVLTAMVDADTMTPKQVAEATGRPRSTLARSIARLTAAGLIERHRNVDDGRSADLRLTSSGRSHVAGFAEAMSDFFVAIGPLVKEYLVVVDRLPQPEEGADPSDPLELASALSSAGSAYVAEVVPLLRGMGAGHFRDRYALVMIAAHGQVRPGRLSEDMGLSAPGVSSLMERLEGRGLVTRHNGVVPGDARSVIVQLTPSGSKAVRTSISVFRRHEMVLSSALARVLTLRR